jgi:hypothetical protein
MTQLSALVQGSGKTAIDKRSYIATAGQTIFAVTYSPSFVEVYQNGVHLNATDYTATTGTSITLVVGAALNDEIEVLGYLNDASIVATYAGATAPSLPIDGTVWYDTTDGSLYVRMTGAWIEASQAGGGAVGPVGPGGTLASITGLGANVSTFLATPNSANLLAAVTDETGSGSLVFSTTPTLTRPVISGFIESVVVNGTVGATATLAISAGTVLTATLTTATACTFTMPTVAAGASFTLILKQPTTGTPTTATFTNVKWGSSGAPIVTAAVNKMDIFSFVSDGTNWYGSTAQGFTY